MTFQSILISNFSREECPPTPLVTRQFGPLRDSSSVIKKYPDFTYSKGWTVCLQFRQVISVCVLYTLGRS